MNDIDTLFERKALIDAKDPGDVTTEDIDTLVLFYRQRRGRKAQLTQSRDKTSLDELMPKPQVRVLPGAIRRFPSPPKVQS